MTMTGPSAISIFITALGALGLPIAILVIFFEVHPKQKKRLSIFEMICILMWLALLVLGVVNLYVVKTIKEDQENNNFSSEELLIKQNYALIQQLKAEYSDMDTEVIKSEDGAYFYIFETAGYVFQDSMKNGEYDVLGGAGVDSAMVVIIDYSNDKIICTLTTDSHGTIHYSPGNRNKFYCVIFHNDYEIYVTCPIQVAYGEYNGNSGSTSFYLEKKDSQYTPLFQLRLHMRDLGTDEPYSIVSDDCNATFCCKSVYDSKICGTSYQSSAFDFGVLQWGDNSYFSLNINYVMDIYLWSWSNSESNSESIHQTFAGSTISSNIVELYFDFNNESDNME